MSIKNKKDKLFPVANLREGGLYSSPYPLNIRNEKYEPIAILESYAPFVVLSIVKDTQLLASKTVRILSTEGVVGTIFANPRHIKDLNVNP